jgi:hypothetical protein
MSVVRCGVTEEEEGNVVRVVHGQLHTFPASLQDEVKFNIVTGRLER